MGKRPFCRMKKDIQGTLLSFNKPLLQGKCIEKLKRLIKFVLFVTRPIASIQAIRKDLAVELRSTHS